MKVSRLGPRAFEQCAGFLRIRDGGEPLDASSVHPEAYGVAKKIVAACGRDVRALMGDKQALKALNPASSSTSGSACRRCATSSSNSRSPAATRAPEFKTATFADGIDDIKDLKPGMRLEGTVTNVAAFGAFVDIGVHQDGLVHVSQLADRFVKDPHDVVKAGDVVKVRVVEVDVARKRIALTMRDVQQSGANAPGAKPDAGLRSKPGDRSSPRGRESAPSLGGLGAKLAEALKRS